MILPVTWQKAGRLLLVHLTLEFGLVLWVFARVPSTTSHALTYMLDDLGAELEVRK